MSKKTEINRDEVLERPRVVGTYSGDMDRKKKEPMYNVRFQFDRSFELHVAGKIYRFEPHGSAIVPRSVIEHPDFKQVASYFGVSEVTDG